MSLDPRQAATAYFDAWRGRDSDLLRSILADDVEFIGPLAQVKGADEYVESIQGLWNMTRVQVTFDPRGMLGSRPG